MKMKNVISKMLAPLILNSRLSYPLGKQLVFL